MKIKIGFTNGGNLAAIDESGNKFVMLSKDGSMVQNPSFPNGVCQKEIEAEDVQSALADEMQKKLLAASLKRQAAEKIEADAMAKLVSRFGWSGQPAIQITSKLQEDVDFKNSLNAKTLKKMLARAEKLEANQKLEKKIRSAAIKAAASLAKKSPKAPLKGVGHTREMWPFNGHNKIAEIICAAIPSNHKTSITTSRRAKGYFSFGLAISPEAAKKMIPLVEKFSK